MSTDSGKPAKYGEYDQCVVCNHTPRYCNCGTTSVPPLPSSPRATDDLTVGRERWPNQPIPGCCGFSKPTGRCCVETNVPQPDEEEDDED